MFLINSFTCVCVCLCIYVCVYMYKYVYIHIYTHIHIHGLLLTKFRISTDMSREESNHGKRRREVQSSIL